MLQKKYFKNEKIIMISEYYVSKKYVFSEDKDLNYSFI